MSVLLNGIVKDTLCGPKLRGEWMFSKDRRSTQPFDFQWKGLKVNRTIMNECSLRSDQLPVNEVNTDGQLNSKTVELVHDNKHSSSETFDDDDDYPKDNSIPPYCIAGRHPMFGLWEGQFTIKTLTGFESVPETFFFYSYFGETRLDDLEQLPVVPWPVDLENFSGHGSRNLLGFERANDGERQFSSTSGASSTEDSVTDLSKSSSSHYGTVELPVETAISCSNHKLTNFSGDAAEITPVLIGCGMNRFGKFTITGVYNSEKRTVLCEKNYIPNKNSLKRGRKISNVDEKLSTRIEKITRMKAANQNFEGKLRKRLKPNIQYAKGFSFDEGSETSSALSKCTRTDAARKKKVAVKFEANLSSPTYGLKALKAPDLKVSWSSCYDIKNEDTFCDFKDAFLDENTGEIYEGGWKFGMKHGPGICLYNDGLLYDGNWNNGKECGKGTLMTGDRKLIYCGDWVEGIIQGYGTYHYVNGDIYVGDWRDGRRHGRGDYVFCNGCRYSGDWKDDKRCGKGLFFWSDDSYYDGEWESDLRQGRGVLDLWNGFRYDGMWWMNNFEGKGVCTFPGGQIYQGTFKNGLREGRGSVRFEEEAIYEGRFKDDKFDGQGTIMLSNPVSGSDYFETLVPVQIQAELWRIHLKAGFGTSSH